MKPNIVTIVTMLAGLCAGGAFAQATPPVAAPATAAPQSAVPPEVAKAQAAHEKDAAKANAKGDKKAAPSKTRKAAPAKPKNKDKMPVDEQNTTAGTAAAVAPAGAVASKPPHRAGGKWKMTVDGWS
jgi:hypothetical protein